MDVGGGEGVEVGEEVGRGVKVDVGGSGVDVGVKVGQRVKVGVEVK